MVTKDSAENLLGIKLPAQANVVKRAFWRLSLLEHPDHSKHPQAAERFAKLKSCYEEVLAGNLVEVSVAEAKTDDGTSLDKLGLGLGPTTNGRPCGACDSRGFYSFSSGGDACPDCRPALGVGIFFGFPTGFQYRCGKCKGSGQFQGKGICYGCNGKGWKTANDRRSHCRTCKGSMRNPETGKKHYSKCGTCKGTGEIAMWNPVLPKGLLGGRA